MTDEAKKETENISYDFRKSTSFIKLNRKQENIDVVKFQKTKDVKLLEKLYHQRIPSLQI